MYTIPRRISPVESSALLHFALAAGGEQAAARQSEIEAFARSQRNEADTLAQQGTAFDALGDWIVQSGIVNALPQDARLLRSQARQASGLKTSSAATTLTDFVNPNPPEEPTPEALIDLEIVAIYW